MLTITEYLENVYEEFKNNIEVGGCLCDLKQLTFEAGCLPDYANPQVQRLYLLRYAFAYSFEYRNMYEEILGDMDTPPEISVTSIGCGAMIDYWSLIKVMRDRHIESKVSYIGIDEIDWNNKFPKRKADKGVLKIGNAKEYLKNSKQFESDIYFFPKSISEFSDREMKIIASSFRENPIKKDVLFLAISLRANDWGMEEDMQKTRSIISAIEDNGFKADKKYNQFVQFEENIGIAAFESDYVYPQEAWDYITNLKEKCENYMLRGKNCEAECEKLNRKPIMKTGLIRYQVIKFERL